MKLFIVLDVDGVDPELFPDADEIASSCLSDDCGVLQDYVSDGDEPDTDAWWSLDSAMWVEDPE